MWLFEQNKFRIKKTLTGQRRNTIILKHLMFRSCNYPHFICICFRQFDCYIYIILWAPYRCLCIFTAFVFDFWPRYLFLVPDSCWASVRNSNSIYAYKLIIYKRGHNQNRLEQRSFLLFLDNLTVSLGLLI
jgi:hypothetical protein